ncbi:MAG: SAM-dependent methyltransferase [Burkholderiales bacterium]|nr:MAG: SAM-dependent methyltransferase [Burkholderiales bacterium]
MFAAHSTVAGLPVPEPSALEASAALAAEIAARIDGEGGWLGFDAFMQLALYAPGLGYYTGAASKFGTGGDFVTAPTLTPLFGECVARQLAQWFGACGFEPTGLSRHVLEFGAGDGSLAADLLVALDGLGAGPERYAILELSAELRARQRARIAARAPAALDRVHWLDRLPERFEGVVLANEVLDAMPVRLVRVLGQQVLERGVALAQARLTYADRPADAGLRAEVLSRLAEAGWSPGADTDYVLEIGEQAEAWVAEIGSRLARGALLIIDYGFPRRELYHPQRAVGTLMCHYRHRAHGDPFAWPGLQDITSHVDFTALARAGEAAGLLLCGYTSQARFLLNTGILDALARTPAEAVREYAPQAHAVQRLLSEAEMGELFKAMVLTRSLPGEPIGFVRGARAC